MNNDFIIILAWPEGFVTASGSWYDKWWNPFLNKEGKYRVGHSALALVNSKTKNIHYFDFGRYHTPFGFGRVRDMETDPDISIKEKAEIDNNKIKNIENILLDISANIEHHGEGATYASLVNNINFKRAFNYAKIMQQKGLIPYGPFVLNGTNCSRFVAKTTRISGVSFLQRIRFKFPFCVSPSPKRNIAIGNNNYYIVLKNKVKKIRKNFLKAYFSSIESYE